MESSEVKRLAETVEEGLRDGRTLESLRNAMEESGYNEEDVREVVGSVDRKNIIRRPQRKKEYNKGWLTAAILIVIVLGLSFYIFITQPSAQAIEPPEPELPETNTSEGLRTCYVVNESVKKVMIEAGAQCDRWFLIKEI